MAKAVADDGTYKRKNRNHVTSRHSKMHPVAKLTNSRRHGGRYVASNRNGNLECDDASPLSKTRTSPRAPNRANSSASPAAAKPASPAISDVPRKPNAPINHISPSTAPATAPRVFEP